MPQKLDDKQFIEQFKTEFFKDVNARKTQHRKMNYHYLMYKGILWLNSIYGEDYLRTVGLQAFVPRTFMTIEAVRSRLTGRPLDIAAKGVTRKQRANAQKAVRMLQTEWYRSGADWEKADSEFYALLLGNGYLLSRFTDEHKMMPVYSGTDKDGKINYEDKDFQKYKGMKLKSLNPWHVFPDHRARGEHDWRHCYIYSLWDFDVWMDYCKENDFKIEGVEKGGHIEEYDAIRRQVDVLYGASNVELKTRVNGQLVSQPLEHEAIDTSNMIMVVERFEDEQYSVASGNNWTLNYRGNNPDPDKIIPIKVIRDYHVPDEFDGIGEAEVIRWQQYEENKVHNLAYMSTLMSTIQRYGIIEDYLVDPTDASFNNPLKWIKMKNIPGGNDINKAMVPLNQKNSNDVPTRFLDIINKIRQESTGVSSYMTSSPDKGVDTLGEAKLIQQGGMEIINHKIYQIEERDLTAILKHWLVCIPQYYLEQMDIMLEDDTEEDIKYLPFDREFNLDVPTIAKLSVENGVSGATTVEEVFLKQGYKDVVFVSDLIGGYDISIKTINGITDREKEFNQFKIAIDLCISVNNQNKTIGLPPTYDIGKLTDEALRLFPDIIKTVEEFHFKMEQQTLPAPGGGMGTPSPEQPPMTPPEGTPAPQLPT